jgi:CubicO group peptidase (beta-lactamase class C family)
MMTDCDRSVRDLLQRAIRAGFAPGAVAAWRRAEEKTSDAAVGAAIVSPEHVNASPDTWFDLASLTKPLVTTTLALLAFRSGAIAATTRVGEVLDEVRGTDVGGLEVRQLLTHTGGLPGWLPLYCIAEGRHDLLASRLGEVRLEARPGERVIYSCVGFVILGLMLRRVADQDLDFLFRRQVLKVVGLEEQFAFKVDLATHSLAGGTGQPTVELRLIEDLGLDRRWLPATGYGLPDDGNARFLGCNAGNAGLFGTARGVAALASEYLPGGGLLLAGAEAEKATTLHTTGLEEGRGWGWQLAATRGCSAGQAVSEAAFGHTGFTGVSVWCDPQTKDVFALMTNRNHPAQRGNDLHPLRRRFHALLGRR